MGVLIAMATRVNCLLHAVVGARATVLNEPELITPVSPVYRKAVLPSGSPELMV